MSTDDVEVEVVDGGIKIIHTPNKDADSVTYFMAVDGLSEVTGEGELVPVKDSEFKVRLCFAAGVVWGRSKL